MDDQKPTCVDLGLSEEPSRQSMDRPACGRQERVMGHHLALQRFDRQCIESNIESRTVWGDTDLSHEDHKDWTTGLALPRKVGSRGSELGGESPGYAEQTTRRTLHSPGVPQRDTKARKWQREWSRVGHDGRGK